MSSPTSPPDASTDSPGRVASLGSARFVALLAVVGLCTSTLATFALAIAKTARLVDKIAGGGWNDELAIVSVLEVVDSYLLAVVQIIVVVGLFELFIADLELPGWLEAKTLDDLKKPIVDVLIVFVAIKGIERFLRADRPLDGLISVAAVAILIVALTAFRVLTKPAAGDRVNKKT